VLACFDSSESTFILSADFDSVLAVSSRRWWLLKWPLGSARTNITVLASNDNVSSDYYQNDLALRMRIS
jgi:hypothetical protein